MGMSGDEELDNLLFSISKTSKKLKKSDPERAPADDDAHPAAKGAKSDQGAGVDPLDVVEMSDQQRKIVTWLSRNRRSNLQAIQEAVGIPAEEVQDLLVELEAEKRIRSVERKGEILYSAAIHGRASRRLRNFPDELWKKAGLDDE
jgi:hypothetical protein